MLICLSLSQITPCPSSSPSSSSLSPSDSRALSSIHLHPRMHSAPPRPLSLSLSGLLRPLARLRFSAWFWDKTKAFRLFLFPSFLSLDSLFNTVTISMSMQAISIYLCIFGGWSFYEREFLEIYNCVSHISQNSPDCFSWIFEGYELELIIQTLLFYLNPVEWKERRDVCGAGQPFLLWKDERDWGPRTVENLVWKLRLGFKEDEIFLDFWTYSSLIDILSKIDWEMGERKVSYWQDVEIFTRRDSDSALFSL